MNKMNKKNWLLLFISLLVGFIFFLHHLIPIIKANQNLDYVFTPFNGADENLYAAQVREVFEGKLLSGDAYIYETKSNLPFTQFLTPLVLGLLARLINSLDLIYLFGDLIMPIILFLLLYKLSYKLTSHYWGSILASLATLFLYQLSTKFPPITLDLMNSFWQRLTLKEPFLFAFHRLIRQFSFLTFLLFLNSFYNSLTNTNKNNFIISGVLLGLLSYIYPVYWTSGMAIIIVSLCLLSLMHSKTKSKKLLITFFIALIISLGFLLQQFNLGIEKQITMGRIEGRFIEPITTLRYGLAALSIWFLVKKQPIKIFLSSIFLAAIGLMNLQLILGYSIDPGHWPDTTFEPLLIYVFFIVISSSLKRYFPDRWLTGLIVVPILVFASLNQYQITAKWQDQYLLKTNETGLYNWLNQNSTPESVVLSLDKRLNRYLPVLTHNNIFLPYGSFSQLSITETWDRINIAFFLHQLTPQDINQKLFDTQFIGQLFEQYYNFDQNSPIDNYSFPDNILTIIKQQHPVFTLGYRYIPDNLKSDSQEKVKQLQNESYHYLTCLYKLDYALINQDDLFIGPINLSDQYWQLVYQADSLLLYKLKNTCQN